MAQIQRSQRVGRGRDVTQVVGGQTAPPAVVVLRATEPHQALVDHRVSAEEPECRQGVQGQAGDQSEAQVIGEPRFRPATVGTLLAAQQIGRLDQMDVLALDPHADERRRHARGSRCGRGTRFVQELGPAAGLGGWTKRL